MCKRILEDSVELVSIEVHRKTKLMTAVTIATQSLETASNKLIVGSNKTVIPNGITEIGEGLSFIVKN